jgi:hypothetical protein
VDEVFVVGLNQDAVPKEHVTEVLQGFSDGKELLFGDWVAFLHIGEVLAEESEWFIVLSDDSSNLLCTCVSVDDEGFVKVWVS